MSIKPIVFNNDIQRPKNMKLKNHHQRSKENIDYENAIKAIKQRNDQIKNKRNSDQKYSDAEFKNTGNIHNYHEQNWAPGSDNIAKLDATNTKQSCQEYSKSNSQKNSFLPVPPPSNNGSRRRPIPVKPKEIR